LKAEKHEEVMYAFKSEVSRLAILKVAYFFFYWLVVVKSSVWHS